MADNSVKMRRVARQTLVVRKAKDDDAKRFDQTDDGKDPSWISHRIEAKSRESTIAFRGGTKAKKPSGRPGPAGAGRKAGVSTKRVPASGRLVLDSDARLGPEASSVTMFFGPGGMSSVRTAGANTVVSYDSGRTVVVRNGKRLSFRRRALAAYAAGYFLLFGLYGYFLLRGTERVAPEEFVRRAFFLRRGNDIPDLEKAAFAAMRGNRSPAEMRLAEPVSFYDDNKDLVSVAAGSRLTLAVAARLGKAILEDQARPPGARAFTRPLALHRETYLATMNWPHWLAVYNSLGFFLIAILFLWRPLQGFLAARGGKTALALKNAHQAKEESLKFGAKYEEMAADIENRRREMRAEAEAEAEAGLTEAAAAARRQAADIEGEARTALELEAAALASRLGAEAAAAACDRAKIILERRLDDGDHRAAIEELIAGIAALRPGTLPGR